MRPSIVRTFLAGWLLTAGLLAGCAREHPTTGSTSRTTKTVPSPSPGPRAGGPAGVASAVPLEAYKPVPGKYGGQLVLSTISDPKSFNPITSGETTTTMYTSLIFLGLTRTNAWTYQVEPELAVSWTPDESGLVWTVKLRRGVTWSDGHPFTADDVLFTYQTIYNKDITCSTRDIITGPHGEEWRLRKIDDYTVEFHLFDRNAIFPLLLATEIIPKHRYEKLVASGKFNEALGTDVDPDELVGTGPFLLERYDVAGRKVIMRRNPRYYRKDPVGRPLPYLDRIVYLIVPNQDVQMLKFRQREIDYVALRGEDFPIFKPLQEKLNFTIYKLGPAMGSVFLFFNQNTGVNPQTGKPYVEPYKLKWFRDVRFRRACSHAIDRQFIVKSIMNGLGYPQYGPMNRYSGFYFCNPNIPRYEYDLDKARALLKEMGLIDRDGDGVLEDPEGHEVAFNLTTNAGNTVRERMAETIRKDLEKLGMKVNYRPMEFNILVSKLDYSFDWEACIIGLTGGPEPAWGANVWRSSGRLHMWFPRQEKPSTDWEAEIDRLFAEGIRELDRQKRRQIYFRWQEIVAEQQPLIYTAAAERLAALRNKFGNVFPAPIGGVLHNIEEIFLLNP